jgi:hypothetical protein
VQNLKANTLRPPPRVPRTAKYLTVAALALGEALKRVFGIDLERRKPRIS